MKRLTGVVLGLWIVAAGAARAEHASIDLRIMRVDPLTNKTLDEANSHADEEPPQGGVYPRPLFKCKANDPLVLQFFFTNTYPHGERKEVSVCYFVVREEKARQKNTPDLDKAVVVTRGRFVLNFKPQTRVGARVQFSIKEPGTYLLRVHSENTQSNHEHFSGIDVQVD